VPVWIQARPVRRITRILAPIDLSEDSLRALSSASALAKALGASVCAVHFFGGAGMYAARAAFEKAVSGFDWQGVEHSAKFLEGEAIEGILELSQSAELIVLGTHGWTGLASAVLGSVAHSVIQRSDRPVLAIPHPARKFLL
jgi:nucleotide-binding universal stress UspA family protein